MSFIATDGGVHPPDKLATACAEQITSLVQIDETSRSDEATLGRRQKKRLVLDIADAIEEHHEAVMKYERECLAEHGTARLSQSGDPSTHEPVKNQIELAAEAVVACAKDTLFEPHFNVDHVRKVVAQIIGSWFATAMDIERDWVAKGHTIAADGKASPNPEHDPKCPHVRLWHTRRAGKAA